MAIIPTLRRSVKDAMRKRFQKCRIAVVRIRYLILFNLWHGRGARDIQTILGVHNPVYSLSNLSKAILA